MPAASLYDMTHESWFHGRANRWKVATHTHRDTALQPTSQPVEKLFSATPVSLACQGAALISESESSFRFVQCFGICLVKVLDLFSCHFGFIR